MRVTKWLGAAAFAAVVLVAAGAFAAEGEVVKAALGDDAKKWLGIAAGFGIALASIGGAYGQSRATAAALEGIARNPGASGKIFVPMIVGLALIESLVLYAWIVSLQLSGKI
jgi:F-type H+-transporting ATPase subunit c